MKKNVVLVLSLVLSSVMFSGCASMKHDIAKNEAKKKAKSNGGIKFKLFNYSYGDFFKKCTYVYGR